MNYYNDNDKFVCAWLRELIKAKLIPNGDVDERSIKDVDPVELDGYTQCHFFAGIGGWSYALKLAGWPEERKVWTGSCPCQPFSSAGKNAGICDERHLWPSFYRLISKCNPAIVFGEQVAGKTGLEWITGIRTQMEEIGYAVGAIGLCSPCVSSPHNRPRFYWVADSSSQRWKELLRVQSEIFNGENKNKNKTAPLDAYPVYPEWDDMRKGMGEPGLLSSSDGISESVVRLRGYGNAIVPQVAAEFIGAYMEIEV